METIGKIIYKDKCVAFIAIKEPLEPDTDWTVYSDDINDKYLLDEYITEEEKRIAFEHIDSCSCGGCPKKMFGKDVEWCYGTNFRFNVSITEDLPFMKKMIVLKMMEIDNKRNFCYDFLEILRCLIHIIILHKVCFIIDKSLL